MFSLSVICDSTIATQKLPQTITKERQNSIFLQRWMIAEQAQRKLTEIKHTQQI
jgi:hypothetical protein